MIISGKKKLGPFFICLFFLYLVLIAVAARPQTAVAAGKTEKDEKNNLYSVGDVIFIDGTGSNKRYRQSGCHCQ